jgi:hypothetical protein
MSGCVILHPVDNVAIATAKVAAGCEVAPGVVACSEVPRSHQVALWAIALHEPVVEFGQVIG